MAIALTVERELLRSGFDFQLIHHRPTAFSLASARVARVPPARVAKGVLLKDDVGYVLLVIPADAALDLTRVHAQLGRDLALSQEAEVALLFDDCSFGAVPAMGSAYGIETWVDQRLAESPDIYFEAGDHQLLVRMETQDYLRVLKEINYGRFTRPGFRGARRRVRSETTYPYPSSRR